MVAAPSSEPILVRERALQSCIVGLCCGLTTTLGLVILTLPISDGTGENVWLDLWVGLILGAQSFLIWFFLLATPLRRSRAMMAAVVVFGGALVEYLALAVLTFATQQSNPFSEDSVAIALFSPLAYIAPLVFTLGIGIAAALWFLHRRGERFSYPTDVSGSG